MRNNSKITIKKKINLSKKKLIEQPLEILKKINIEKLTKITSLSLAERYKNFKEKIKQKEKNKIELSKKEKIPSPKGVIHHFMPWFTADSSNNSLHIIAYGETDTTTWETQAYHTYSYDNGKTWEHHALEESFSPTPDHFFGDYNGIVAHPKSGIHMVWTQQVNGVNSIFYGNMSFDKKIKAVDEPIKKKKKRSKE